MKYIIKKLWVGPMENRNADGSFYNAPHFKPKYGKTKTGKWVRLYTKSEILGMRLSDILVEEIRKEIDKELISELEHTILDMKYRSDSIA